MVLQNAWHTLFMVFFGYLLLLWVQKVQKLSNHPLLNVEIENNGISYKKSWKCTFVYFQDLRKLQVEAIATVNLKENKSVTFL
jgi:hypothetical protein